MHAKLEERFCSLTIYLGSVDCECQKLVRVHYKASRTLRLPWESLLADGKL